MPPPAGEVAWRGALAHIGPVETVAPLLDRISGTTTCAQVALCAGIVAWGAWRFPTCAAAEENALLAEAAFAHMVDFRYLKWNLGVAAPDQPPEVSASVQLGQFLREATDRDKFWDSYFQPVRQSFHAANIVRHVLPRGPREAFDDWLASTIDRLKVYAPKPDTPPRRPKTFPDKAAYFAYVAPHRGDPLPPEVLDPAFAYRPDDRAMLVGRFLASLDPARNRFLRTHDERVALGLHAS